MAQAIGRLKEIFDNYLQNCDRDHNLQLERQPLDGALLAQQMLSEAETMWGKRFFFTRSGETPFLVDVGAFRTAVFNLLDNAVKYSPPDTPIVAAITATQTGASLVIENTMASAGEIAMDRVFDKYYRSKNTHGTIGTGVGLYLVRKIVEEHGGTAEVHILENVRFRVILRIPGFPKSS
jgi:two-component system sensor histidine kinase KdpD